MGQTTPSDRIALNLAQNLTWGLASFLTYESTCGMGQVFSEYYLYAPILRIGRSLGWDVRDQVKESSNGLKGASKTLDFAMGKENTIILLEVKWVGRPTSNSNALAHVKDDVEKLWSGKMKRAIQRRFELVTDRESPSYYRWILVAGVGTKYKAGKDMRVRGSQKIPESAERISYAFLGAPRRHYGAEMFHLSAPGG